MCAIVERILFYIAATIEQLWNKETNFTWKNNNLKCRRKTNCEECDSFLDRRKKISRDICSRTEEKKIEKEKNGLRLPENWMAWWTSSDDNWNAI